MAQDFALPVRRAILPRLKADPDVIALVPAAQIYPSTVGAKPTFPFIRYGAPIVSPFVADGLDSSSIQGAIHAFTNPVYNDSDAMTITAEDQAHKMASAIGRCIDEAVLPIDNGYKVRIIWTGSTLLQDTAEADAWHAVVNFKAEVAG